MFFSIAYFFLLFELHYVQGCPSHLSCDLRLSCGGDQGSVMSVYSVDTKTAIIVDTLRKTSVLCDGTKGVQFFYDLNQNKGIMDSRYEHFIQESISQFNSHVENVNSIDLNDIEGEQFTLQSPPNDIINMHFEIIKTLQPELVDYGKVRRLSTFSIMINLLKEMVNLKKEALSRIIETKLKLKTMEVSGGVMNVVSTLRGMAKLNNVTSKEFENIVENNHVDLQPLFTSECGTESLAVLVNQVNKPNSQLYGVIEDPTTAYEVIKEFSGGQCTGLKGLENLVLSTALYTNKVISTENLLDKLIRVAATYKPINTEMINEKLDFVLNVLKSKLSSNRGRGIVSQIEKLKQGNLIINKINISSIMQEISMGGGSKIDNILQVLSSLHGNFVTLAAKLVQRIIFFTLTGQGLPYSVDLFPNLKHFINSNSKEEILVQISKQIKQPKILNTLKKIDLFNIVKIISSLPVLKEVFGSFENTLSQFEVKKEVFEKECIKQGFLPEVFSWLRYGAGIRGGIKPRGCVHDMGLLGIDRMQCRPYD